MANRFLVSGGSGLWTGTNNWSLTSGGASGVSFPVNGDAVTFDTNSGASPITVDTAAQACTSLSITSGYTGTLTMTNTLTVAGACTLGANMTIAGAAALIISTTATLTSNGKTWPSALTLSSNVTYTLADNWTVTGTFSTTNTTGATTINGNILNCSGSVTFGFTSGFVTGTTVINMNGTGTLSSPSMTTGTSRSPITVNTAGAFTLSGAFRQLTGTFTITAFGTFTTTGSTFTLAGGTLTVNAANVVFSTFAFTAANTINGSQGFSSVTWLSTGTGGTQTFLSGNTYTVTSSLTITGTSAAPFTLQSSTGSSAFNLNFNGTTMALAYVTATDVDSSGGKPIYDFGGTATRSPNWTTGSNIAAPGFIPANMRGNFEN